MQAILCRELARGARPFGKVKSPMFVFVHALRNESSSKQPVSRNPAFGQRSEGSLRKPLAFRSTTKHAIDRKLSA